MGRLSAYLNLTKPRIIASLLATTLGAMLLAARGLPPLPLVALTMLGGALGAGAAIVFVFFACLGVSQR